jgi:hypothetical protein
MPDNVLRGWVVVNLPSHTGWQQLPGIRRDLDRAVRAHLRSRCRGVIVDHSSVLALDDAVFVALVRAYVHTHTLGHPLRLVIPPGRRQLQHIVHNIGLSTILGVYPCLQAAVLGAPAFPTKVHPARIQPVVEALRQLSWRAHGLSLPQTSPIHADLSAKHFPPADLTVTVDPAEARDRVRISAHGAFTLAGVRRLAEVLTSLVDRNVPHLRLEAIGPSQGGDLLPVLMAIRWRTVALQGCLHLPDPPQWIHRILTREGLLQSFGPCADCSSHGRRAFSQTAREAQKIRNVRKTEEPLPGPDSRVDQVEQ